MSKSIEGLTIEELKSVKLALMIAVSTTEIHSKRWEENYKKWCRIMIDVDYTLKDELFEQERKKNLPL
jgi:hypothetical protein